MKKRRLEKKKNMGEMGRREAGEKRKVWKLMEWERKEKERVVERVCRESCEGRTEGERQRKGRM